jgi:pimeloyl-ACP methyl ester carboxylesterase
MPYADNRGVRIHYEVEGQGPPLVQRHGFSMTSEDWREYGYVAGLRDRYTLILMDSRGYGASDKPHDPNAYLWPHLVGDVIAVIDELHLDQVHFWGWSMGGDMAFALAQAAPERLKTVIIGSGCAVGVAEPDKPNEFRENVEQGGAAWLVELWKQNLAISKAQEARLEQLDIQALSAELRAPYSSLESIPPTMSMPCLLYVGQSEDGYDCVLNNSQQMPNTRFASFPGFNHFDTWARSDVVLPQVLEFLGEG